MNSNRGNPKSMAFCEILAKIAMRRLKKMEIIRLNTLLNARIKQLEKG